MEVKTSLLDNMIGVGDMVLLEPLSEETFIGNLQKRFDHNEIYVSSVKSFTHCLSLDISISIITVFQVLSFFFFFSFFFLLISLFRQ